VAALLGISVAAQITQIYTSDSLSFKTKWKKKESKQIFNKIKVNEMNKSKQNKTECQI